MAEISAQSSVSSLQSCLCTSILGHTTLVAAFLYTVVSVTPMYGTVAGLRGLRVLTVIPDKEEEECC